MMVTEHFATSEFDQPSKHGLLHVAYPPEWIDDRLRPLCTQLEALRTYCAGRCVTVLSGYRTPEFNRAVGGAARSQHLEGRAADVVVEGLSAGDVQDAVEHLLVVGLLPLVRGVGIYRTWTHLDIRFADGVVRWVGQRGAA